jgi:hypothetical protein
VTLEGEERLKELRRGKDGWWSGHHSMCGAQVKWMDLVCLAVPPKVVSEYDLQKRNISEDVWV